MTSQPARPAISEARREEPDRLRAGRADLAVPAAVLAEYDDLVEHGRVPPARVLDAIAGALGLDEDERIYLGHLARRTVQPRTPGLPRPRG